MADRMDLDDDDDIDIDSSPQPDNADGEYEVDRVLGEKSEDGRQLWLLAWVGYPLIESTWEPRENILADEVLQLWEETKLRVSQGLEEPFDVDALEGKKHKLAEEKAERHRRRKVKRRSMGLPVSPAEQDEYTPVDNSDSSDDLAEEVNEIEDAPGMVSRPVMSIKGMAERQKAAGTSPPKKQPQRNKRLSTSSSNEPPPKRHDRNNVRATSESSDDMPLSLPRQKAASQPKRPMSNTLPDPSPQTQNFQIRGRADAIANSDTVASSAPTRWGQPTRGRTATRGGKSSSAPSHVFAHREGTKTKPKPTLVQNAADPTKKQKPFTNAHQKRKAELQGREKPEGAPNLDTLPGGLIDPSKPIARMDLSSLRKPMQLDDAENDLFVPQNEPSLQVFTSSFTPNSVAATADRLKNFGPEPKTCFFWNRFQRGETDTPCGRSNCWDLHEYREGIKIADPPRNWTESAADIIRNRRMASSASSQRPNHPGVPIINGKIQLTCYYWHKFQHGLDSRNCNKNDDACGYCHYEKEGMDIADNPNASGSTPERTSDFPPWRADSSPGQNVTKLNFTCWFWNRSIQEPGNPDCSKGESCNFYHCYKEGMPIANPPPGQAQATKRSTANINDTPVESLRPPFGHPQEPIIQPSNCHPDSPLAVGTASSSKAEIPGPAHHQTRPGNPLMMQPSTPATRPSWDPWHPMNAICYLYEYDGRCDGENCTYIHRKDDSIPAALSSTQMLNILFEMPLEEFCHWWIKGDCRWGSSCNRGHTIRPLQTLHQKKNVCQYWKRGSCRFGTNCRDLHENHVQENPSPRKDMQGRSLDNGDTSKAPASIREPHLAEPSRWANIPTSTSVPTASAAQINMLTSHVPDRSMEMPQRPNLNLDTRDMRSISAEEPQSATLFSRGSSYDSQISAPTAITIPAPVTTPSDSKPKKRTALEDYSRRKLVKLLENPRNREVVFGPPGCESVYLDFGELPSSGETWESAFMSTQKLVFDQMCMAQDFMKREDLFERQLWGGGLAPAVGAQDARKVAGLIERLVNELGLRSAGVFCACADFCMLVFPARKEEWKFLEHNFPASSSSSSLLYLIFQSPLSRSMVNAIETTPHSATQQGTLSSIPAPNIAPSNYRDLLVKNIHDLAFVKLISVSGTAHNPFNLYLLFPPAAGQTGQFIASWVQSQRNPHLKIYSSQTLDSWSFLVQNKSIRFGAVLIHESAIPEIDRLTGLFDLLADRTTINFFCISDSNTVYALYPSRNYEAIDRSLGKVTATPIFPSSSAILLTPSFLVAHPDKALRILEWLFVKENKFAQSVITAKPRILGCHKLLDYIRDLAISKAIEKDEFDDRNKDNIQREHIALAQGLTYADCETRFNIHQILVDLDMSNENANLDDSDSEWGDEYDIPVSFAPDFIGQDDEQQLIDWFAGWSILNADRFRRFMVIGTDSSSTNLSRRKEVRVKRPKSIPQQSSTIPEPVVEKPIAQPPPTEQIEQPVIEQTEAMQQKQRALEIAAKYKPAANADSNPASSTTPTIDPPRSQWSPLPATRTKPVAFSFPVRHPSLPSKPPTPGSHSQSPNPLSPTNETELADRTAAFERQLGMLAQKSAQNKGRPGSSASNTGSLVSTAGIVDNGDGKRVVPSTVRNDGSLRGEKRVKEGYVPPEDRAWKSERVEIAKSLSRKGSSESLGLDGSGDVVVAGDDSDDMDLDYDSDSALPTAALTGLGVGDGEGDGGDEMVLDSIENDGGKDDEYEAKWEDITYERTTEWYEKFKQGRGGVGYEHICVAGWERSFRILSVDLVRR